MPSDKTNQFIDDIPLLRAIGEGEQWAFNVLFERYRRRVYAVSLRVLKNDLLAEEVLHDVFLKLWLHSDPSSIENPERYLATMTRNFTIDLLRGLKPMNSLDEALLNGWDAQHNETEETILVNDTQALLQEAIGQLTPQQEKVYRLCREQGLKYEEAAERLSISVLTVKTHMQQALRFVRAYVRKHQGSAIAVILADILLHRK